MGTVSRAAARASERASAARLPSVDNSYAVAWMLDHSEPESFSGATEQHARKASGLD